jgi:hypothetical protein
MPEIPPDHPSTPREGQELVETRKQTILEAYESENDFIQGLTQNYDNDVKRDLDTPAQVIPELLQNADDVEMCREVVLQISENELLVKNDGRPLGEEEFKALCHIGESTKQEPGYIGHFGRGFKSVFSVTDNPQIRSGHLRFQFQRERCVLPEHLNPRVDPNDISYLPETEIRLPLNDLSEQERNQLERQIDEISRLMPHLRHISELIVDNRGERTHYRREEIDRGALTEVKIYRNGSVSDRRHLFSVKRVPPSDEFAELVEHRALDNEEAFRDKPIPITLSVPVDVKGTPDPTEDSGRLFNFFPTQTQLDIPFDIHADFLLNSDRTALKNTQGPYNNWIFGQVADAYEKAVEHYLKQSPPSDAFLDILPTRIELDPYLEEVQQDMLEILQERSCILGQDGEWHLPEEVIVPKDDLGAYLSEADIEQILGKEVYFPADSITKRQLLNFVKIGLLEEFSTKDIVTHGRGSDIYRNKSVIELLQLVSLFNELWEENFQNKRSWDDDRKEFLSAVKETPLIPLQGGGIVSVDEYDEKPALPPKGQDDEYAIFVDRVTLVDLTPEWKDTIQADEFELLIQDARSFFTGVLELEQVTEEYVITEVIAPAFRNSDQETDETLDSYLEFIIEESNRRSIAIKNDALRFRTKASENGESVYEKPGELFLSDEYGLEYSLETILDGIEESAFVTPAYLELDGRTRRWVNLLTKAGVMDNLEVEEESKRSRDKFRKRTELVSALESRGDTSTSPPESPPRSKTKSNWWLNRYRYALSDYRLGEIFEQVLSVIEEEKAEPRARQLALLLSEEWVYYENRCNMKLYYADRGGKGSAYYANDMETDCPASFITKLRETSWCPTKAGTLQPPSTLLIESPQTQDQSVGRYLDSELNMPEEVYKELGVSTRLSPDAVLNLLKKAQTVWGDQDPSNIRSNISMQVDQLRAELSDEPEEEIKRFTAELQEAPFIYVESASTQFRTPQEVVLEGISLGDRFVSISNIYTHHHEFFEEQLRVRKRVAIEDCVTFLAEHTGDELSDEHLKAWNEVVRRLLNDLETLSAEEFQNLDAVEILAERDAIPTQRGQTVQVSAVEFFCPDEEFLGTIESQDVLDRTIQQPLRTNYSQQRLNALWNGLALRNLRSEISLDLVEDSIDSDESESNLVWENSRLAKLLTVWRIYVDAQDDSVGEYVTKINEVAGYRLTDREEIEGYYTLSGNKISGPISIPSYIDHRNDRLLLTGENEAYYHIASELAGLVPLDTDAQQELEALLSGAVGTESALLGAYLDSQGLPGCDVEGILEEVKEREVQPEDGGNEPSEEYSSEGDVTESRIADSGEEDNQERPLEEPNSKEDDASAARPKLDVNIGKSSGEGQPETPRTATGAMSGTGPNGTSGASSTVASSSGKTPSSSADMDSTSKSDKSGAAESTFDPSVSAGELEGQTVLENRREDTISSHSGGSSGATGCSGGQAAEDVGLYGEEFVLAQIATIIRENYDTNQITWNWNPEFIDIEELAEPDDRIDRESIISSKKYNCNTPGVSVDLPEHTIHLLHVRDAGLGADILAEGISFTEEPEQKQSLTPKVTAPDKATWTEVKSTKYARRVFPMTIGEYGRARERQKNYHIIRLCRVGSPEMYVDRRMTDLGSLLETNEIRFQAEEPRLEY